MEDHKRWEEDCVDMVPDPNYPPGTNQLNGARGQEYAKLHASTMDTIIYNRDLDGSDSVLAERAALATEMFGQHAGKP